MMKLSVQDLNLSGLNVLMRVDFNLPMDEKANITDDTRIRAALSTLEYLLANGATPILMSHLGRPKGEVKAEFSLAPIAARLQELTQAKVHFATDCIGDAARNTVKKAKKGEIVLLENLRFHRAETENDPEFAQALSEWGDVYANDAFGTAHRAHASTVGVTKHFEACVSGLLMAKELEKLSVLKKSPARPFLAILGGAKVSGKIEVVENLINKVDTILIGGGMAFTFLKAHGLETGSSLLEEDLIDKVKEITAMAKDSTTRLILPEDIVVSESFSEEGEHKDVLVTDIPEKWMGLDIGPRTTKRFVEEVQLASTVFWNGPMGVFEMPSFARGTRAVARAVAQLTENGAFTVVGGGDSVAAVNQLELESKITHISTGGGASLEYMAGKKLPGVDSLSDAKSIEL